MIYKQCLVYPWELIPFPAFYERDEAGDKPWNALLFVNKTIYSEAATVFYGQNTWRLSDHAGKTRSQRPGRKGGLTLWDVHLHSMRHITIALDGRVLKMVDVWETGKGVFTDGGYKDTDKDRYAAIHEGLEDLLEDHWAKKLCMLKKMNVKIKSLRVDLTNAYCPTAHCRPIELVARLLEMYVPYPKDPTKLYVVVTGMMTEDEAYEAHESGLLCEYCDDGEDEDGNFNSYCTRSLPSSSY